MQIGERWVYTTPRGLEIEHEVTSLTARPKHSNYPGPCVRLVAIDGSMPDTVTWPHLIEQADFWTPAQEGSDDA